MTNESSLFFIHFTSRTKENVISLFVFTDDFLIEMTSIAKIINANSYTILHLIHKVFVFVHCTEMKIIYCLFRMFHIFVTLH